MIKVKITDRKQKLHKINSKIKIGFLSNLDSEIIMRAARNEFGVPFKIPERSFMRSVIDERKDDIIKFAERLIPSVLIGQLPREDMVRKIGRYVKELIVHKIMTAGQWATPLSSVTIEKKGHSRPLIDTYKMVTSVNYEEV